VETISQKNDFFGVQAWSVKCRGGTVPSKNQKCFAAVPCAWFATVAHKVATSPTKRRTKGSQMRDQKDVAGCGQRVPLPSAWGVGTAAAAPSAGSWAAFAAGGLRFPLRDFRPCTRKLPGAFLKDLGGEGGWGSDLGQNKKAAG